MSVSVFSMQRHPELVTILQVQSYQWWMKRTHHLPCTAGCAPAWCAARDAAGGLGGRGHCSLVFSILSYWLRLLLLQSCFPSCWPPACTGMWVHSIPAAEILGVLVLIPVMLYPLRWANEQLLLELLILRRSEKPSSALCVVEDLMVFKSEYLSAILSA